MRVKLSLHGDQPIPFVKAPLHIVSLGASGTGKTHLQEKVGELIPEEDKLEVTSLSENAFYYFRQRELKKQADTNRIFRRINEFHPLNM